jgi:transposase
MHGRGAHAAAGATRHGGALLERDGIQLQALSHQSKKKRDPDLVAGFAQQLDELTHKARAGELDLCFFDESGFSPNPPMQSGWSLRGQTREVCPGAHHQRVNVLGCLQKGVRLAWETLPHTVERQDVINFFDRLADTITRKTVVVLDNAPIHRGEPMRHKQVQWESKGLHLLYLPPYSPEFNAIEILWKQAKYFWRRFLTLSGNELLQEVQTLMQAFGTEYTIDFQ